MTDKDLNLFYEFAARCVHLSIQEEQCNFSFWGNSKMYTCGTIANSEMTATAINKKWYCCQNKNFSGTSGTASNL